MSFVYGLFLILIGTGQAFFLCIVLKKQFKARSTAAVSSNAALQARAESILDYSRQAKEFKEALVPIKKIREQVEVAVELGELLQAERGRTAITHVELEAVEIRLRELEEIERELEASEQETREELRILKKREAELREKNAALKEKIAESNALLEQLMSEIQFSEKAKESLRRMQGELEKVEVQIESIINQVSLANDRYFSLKRRYDALDIEYAQLYEKFVGD